MDLKKLSGIAPISSAVLVAACVGVSLGDYVAPQYVIAAPEYDEDAEAAASDMAESESESETETESETISDNEFDLEDGTYTGEGTGYNGTIKVSVEIKNKKIVSITILSTIDDEAFFNRAKSGVIDAIIKNQSWDVDTVSGATYSSKGIIAAVKNALTGQKDTSAPASESQSGAASGASKTISQVTDASSYKDGTYYGTGTGFGGPLTVCVTISGGKISNITITQTSDGSSYISSASSLISTIISTQSTNVDTVSGATYSSVGIIQAVRNALAQAAVSGSTDNNNGGTTQPETTDNKNNQADDGKEGTFPYDDGAYEGTAFGYNDDITVSVVIKNKKITAINVVSQDDDPAFFNRAVTLLDKMVANQTVDVDTVSGATYSSEGLIGAVKAALESAKTTTDKNHNQTPESENKEETKEETKESESIKESENTGETDSKTDQKYKYKDGTYEVTVTCSPDEDEDFKAYPLRASVTIKNDQIIAIDNVVDESAGGNDKYIGWAVSGRTSGDVGMVQQIIEASKKNTDKLGSILENSLLSDDKKDASLGSVDTITRATCTSKALINIGIEALKAAKLPADENQPETKESESVKESETVKESESIKESESSKESESTAETEGSKESEKTDKTDESESKEETKESDALESETEKACKYEDGTYQWSVTCYPDEDEEFAEYTLSMIVELQGDRIVSITNITGDGDADNDSYIAKAANGKKNAVGVVQQITEITDTDQLYEILENSLLSDDEKNTELWSVDAVSGATCSSKALIEACLQVLQNAVKGE